MKKFYAIIISAVMVATLAGCGGNNTVTLPSSEADSVRQEGKEIENHNCKHLVLTSTARDPEVAPDYNPWADGLVKFKEEVEKKNSSHID